MESRTNVDLLSDSLSSNLNSSKVSNNNCRAQSSIGNNASVCGGHSGGSGLINNKNESFSLNTTPMDTDEHQIEVCDRLDEHESVLPKIQQETITTHTTQEQHKAQQNILTHHMLQNILQGKKDLIALDQELRSVIIHHSSSENLKQNTTGGDCSDDVSSQSKKNLISISKINTSATNNNNNVSTNRNLDNTCENRLTPAAISSNSKSITHLCSKSSISNLIGSGDEVINTLGSCSDVQLQVKSECNAPTTPTIIENTVCNLDVLRHRKSSENLCTDEHVTISGGIDELNFSEMQHPKQVSQPDCRSLINDIVTKKEAEDMLEDDMMLLSSRSDLESMGSPTNSDIQAEEHGKDDDPMVNTSVPTLKPIVVLDNKRARVENIVSSMQSSPSSQNQMNLQVNGCKKRKLYQPQQHAMERYAAAAAGFNFGLNMQSPILEEDEEDIEESTQIHEKPVQKNALKSQLRTMQEQLAEMQQKYVQLCSRMEQESEPQELDDTPSDNIENDGNLCAISPALSLTNSTHTTSLQRPLLTSTPLYSTKPKIHASGSVKPDLNAHAASMYLGQHLLLEHEVRIAKENAEQQERQQQLFQQQQQKKQQLAQHENQRRFEQEHKEALFRKKEQQQQHQRQQNQQREAQHHRLLSAVDARLFEPQVGASAGNHLQAAHWHQRSHQPHQDHMTTSTQSSIKSEISEKFNILRSHSSSTVRMSGSDLEGLADAIKSEITTSLNALVDTIVTRFVHQRRLFNKKSQSVAAAADQFNKDLMMASHILDRKSPRIKVAEQLPSNSMPTTSASLSNTSVSKLISTQPAATFQAPKTPQSMSSVAPASIYSSIGLGGSGSGPFCMPETREQIVEQNEALSLVVASKKKRHKVTDTRITPRTIGRIFAQDGVIGPNFGHNLPSDSNYVQNPSSQQSSFINQNPPISTSNLPVASTSLTPSKNSSPQHIPSQPPAPQMSVTIPNPSLHESQAFSPYSPFFNPHHELHGSSHLQPVAAQMHHMKMSSSPAGLGSMMENRESPPLLRSQTILHPALLAAVHHGNSPDYSAHLRAALDVQDRNSDANSTDIQFEGIQQNISFLKQQISKSESPTSLHSSTLTPMHLRKAKLMFFWVRYPSSAVLKMYFPDIKFNKNNTAQLVKWFSNFREFYYIQMEKYARQAVTEGVETSDDLHVGNDSELYRILNLHYNRNNHIEVPSNFRFVVEQTLREFFKAIQGGKDTEQSWKKSIYKIISRMDDPVPEYFKSPNFLEQLE